MRFVRSAAQCSARSTPTRPTCAQRWPASPPAPGWRSGRWARSTPAASCWLSGTSACWPPACSPARGCRSARRWFGSTRRRRPAGRSGRSRRRPGTGTRRSRTTGSAGVCDSRTAGVVHTLTEYGIVGKIGVGVRHRGAGAVSVHFNALRHAGRHRHRRRAGACGGPTDPRRGHRPRSRGRAGGQGRGHRLGGRDGDRRGAGGWSATTIELRPDGPSLVGARDGWLAHTNHFVADDVKDAGPGEHRGVDHPRATRPGVRGSPSRRHADRPGRAGRPAGHPRPRAAQRVCARVPDAPVGQRSATLAVAVTEPADGRLHVHAGLPCQGPADGWWSSR